MQPAPDARSTIKKRRSLLAIYDLSVAPTSYDFLGFLALAELKRRRDGYDRFDVVFVPTPQNGFWDKEATSQDEKIWRLQNLLTPMCWLWSACGSVSILGTRADALPLLRIAGNDTYPERYRLDDPVPDSFQFAHIMAARACGESMPNWEAPQRARDLVAAWLAPRARGRRVVTISLREASYYQARNSNLDLWIAFARELDVERYFVAFVRDTELAFAPVADTIGSFEIFPAASISLALRAALYEASYMLMMPSHGPINLLLLHTNCHGVVCDLLNPGAANSTAAALRSLGWEIGRQAPLLGATKRFLWESATPSSLARAFAETAALVEAGRAGIGARTVGEEAEPPLRLARRLRDAARYEAAYRIYRHEAEKGSGTAGALCGLSLVTLAMPFPGFRRWRKLRRWIFVRQRRLQSAYHFARACRIGLTRWRGVDEGVEVAQCLEKWRLRRMALAIYTKILEQYPADATALFRLAVDARDRGDREKARHLMSGAVKSDPYSGRYHAMLGELLEACGEAEAAREQYDLALTCDRSVALPAAQQGG